MGEVTDKSTDELIHAWHRFHANVEDKEKRESDRWAVSQVSRLLHDSFLKPEYNVGIIDDPERAWEIIVLLIESAPSRKALLAVATGPLRQLLNAYFDEFVERVSAEATRDSRFAYVLGHTFIRSSFKSEQLYALGQGAAVLSFGQEDAQKQLDERERLVEEWFRWMREPDLPTTVDWVIDQMYCYLPECDPHGHWLVINRLLQESQSKEELQHVGALIGDLLTSHYYEFIESIKQKVKSNRRLAYALGSAYLDETQKAEWAEFIDLVNQYRTDEPFSK